MYKVLLVDDEEWALEDLERYFVHEKDFEIIVKTISAQNAWNLINDNPPDVVFTDIRMPVYTGLDLARMSKEKGIKTYFVIVSGYDDFLLMKQAIQAQVFDYCLKPLEEEQFQEVIQKLRHQFETIYDEPDQTLIHPSLVIYNPDFQNVIYFVNENYMNKLKLKDVSNQFFISESYCGQLFMKHFGLSFSDYITKLRMLNAKKLFADKTKSVYEVSVMVGYPDYYYFNKVFKKQFGLTPYQYKKKVNDM